MTELEQLINQALAEKNEKLKPYNLKKGISLYGITGTLDVNGGSSAEPMDFICLDDLKNYPEKEIENNICLLLLSSVAEINVNYNAIFNPDIVTFETKPEDLALSTTDSGIVLETTFDSTQFKMIMHTEDNSVSMAMSDYSSTDGLTYVKATSLPRFFTEGGFRFDEKVFTADQVNGVISKFLIPVDYDGVYEYATNPTNPTEHKWIKIF